MLAAFQLALRCLRTQCRQLCGQKIVLEDLGWHDALEVLHTVSILRQRLLVVVNDALAQFLVFVLEIIKAVDPTVHLGSIHCRIDLIASVLASKS